MIRLLYISTARERHSPAILEDILRMSRRNNTAANVTGLLIAGGNRFLQVLEGPEQSVQSTYDRICQDVRHRAPVVLKREPIKERAFGSWSMGFQAGGPTLPPTAGISDQLAALMEPIEDPTLRAYFEGFVRQHAA
ncbi:BLUF domain-containing protein [Sphingomonas panacisoli]|uniref:BLUF domain-containing protein n=1 Tax=Sphingomonas panacisoli TaxID=1813879 RepID=A0A5B8LG39_9SPHN|nr:BLUF domain-containing protein [Sphingomonas panacisoli]QDZ06869.1 BLUF domain-containing protein [Sphingomonas panacisoli]